MIWLIIASIMFIGFCQSFLIAAGYGMKEKYQEFQMPVLAFLSCVVFSQHDYITESPAPGVIVYPVVAKALFFINTILCDIIMANLLIATFSDLYEQITERENEWIRQWALTVTGVEQMV